jgi:hypothetical protein
LIQECAQFEIQHVRHVSTSPFADSGRSHDVQ